MLYVDPNKWYQFGVHVKQHHKPDELKKFAILKKGIGIESQNLCKQFNDQKTIQTRWNSTVAYRTKS